MKDLPNPQVERFEACYQLTSVSSIESCADITLRTFFLLLSCISPANSNSSRMKYAFWKLKICDPSILVCGDEAT